MEEFKLLTTVEELKAVSGPYRYKILHCFHTIGVPATVKQVADQLGEVPSKVYYHVKKMEAANILVLHHTQEINGIVAKFYELTARNFEIKREAMDDITTGIFLSESQKIISQVYAESRDIFINVLSKNKNEKDKIKGIVSTQEVYLTQAQVEGLAEYIKAFAEENKQKDGDGESKYHYFLTLFNME